MTTQDTHKEEWREQIYDAFNKNLMFIHSGDESKKTPSWNTNTIADGIIHIVEQLLSTQKQAYKREVKQKIFLVPKTQLEDIRGEDCYEEGYEQCLDDIIKALSEME